MQFLLLLLLLQANRGPGNLIKTAYDGNSLVANGRSTVEALCEIRENKVRSGDIADDKPEQENSDALLAKKTLENSWQLI